MKHFRFKDGLEVTASTKDVAKVIATRVNRVGNSTTEFAYPVLQLISNQLIKKIPSSQLSKIRQGYALIDTPKGYQIEFEMNDNTKNSFVRVLEDGNVTKQININNWYDNTIPELYTKVSTELKKEMHKQVAFVK